MVVPGGESASYDPVFHDQINIEASIRNLIASVISAISVILYVSDRLISSSDVAPKSALKSESAL